MDLRQTGERTTEGTAPVTADLLTPGGLRLGAWNGGNSRSRLPMGRQQLGHVANCCEAIPIVGCGDAAHQQSLN